MKDTRQTFPQFSFYNWSGIQEYLEKMAERGWMLEKMGRIGWRFRRCEPKMRRVAVTYFPEASEFDPEPSDGQRTYLELCEGAGWRLAASWFQMQVFYAEEDSAVPIETDAVVQVETVHAAMKANFLKSYYVLMGLAILQLIMRMQNWGRDPVTALSDPGNLFLTLCWFLLLAECLVEILGYFGWHKKAKRTAEEEGRFLPTPDYRWVMRLCFIALLAAAAGWIRSLNRGLSLLFVFLAAAYVLIVLAADRLRDFLKKKKISRGRNRAVTFAATFLGMLAILVVLPFWLVSRRPEWSREENRQETYTFGGETWTAYLDELPLEVGDLREAGMEGYSCRLDVQKTFLAADLEAWQDARMGEDLPELSYRLVVVRNSYLLSVCRAYLLDLYDNSEELAGLPGLENEIQELIPVDPGMWEAEAAYRIRRGGIERDQYLVCWPDRILVIRFGWEPTGEQIRRAAECLKQYQM